MLFTVDPQFRLRGNEIFLEKITSSLAPFIFERRMARSPRIRGYRFGARPLRKVIMSHDVYLRGSFWLARSRETATSSLILARSTRCLLYTISDCESTRSDFVP
ncbi:hypothetical protein N7465_009205 [Penicillium sp. CMV-2018d]|nr:hypothetical protein N7465_009205 [Penicillium sp. CMV-2018d]